MATAEFFALQGQLETHIVVISEPASNLAKPVFCTTLWKQESDEPENKS